MCRAPRIVLLVNQKVRLTEAPQSDNTVRLFPSIAVLLGESPVTFEELLRHDDVINQLLGMGYEKLDELRRIKPDAAGLVVATDIEHAQQIAYALDAIGESCRVVTNRTPDAQRVISAFRHRDCRWIVAVGMISEGTDIPRLQVCCHLSRIRTELHYLQVLGRILRRAGESDNYAWLFTLAEPPLRQFTEHITDDLPEDLAVLSQVEIPVFPNEALTADTGLVNETDQSVDQVAGQAPVAARAGGLSLGDGVTWPSYQLSCLQHYRQVLLACFLGGAQKSLPVGLQGVFLARFCTCSHPPR